MRKTKKENRGITLIALVITIIVMLILVAVTISMAINGGLFEKAGEAVGDTKNEINKEQELANGKIQVGDQIYNSIDEYIKDMDSIKGNNGEKFSPIYNKNTPITQKEGNKEYTAVIPKGFSVGISEGINKISGGLVIRDANGNEFVWIPVTEDLGSSYSHSSYSEPKELDDKWYASTNATKPKYDSQEILDELYGKNYYTYLKDFKYAEEYAEMVAKVNENDGFYIGRYETTIDVDGSIGSKYNTEVLTARTTLFTKEGTNYPYRWYGLYYALKNANVTGNGEDVQTAMIYGVLYDKAMDFIRTQKAAEKTKYDVDSSTNSWHGSSNGHTDVVNSGTANPNKTDEDGNTVYGDVALNIWDLESNATEWTQEANSSRYRVGRGGYYNSSFYASYRYYYYPTNIYTNDSSRLALYIK